MRSFSKILSRMRSPRFCEPMMALFLFLIISGGVVSATDPAGSLKIALVNATANLLVPQQYATISSAVAAAQNGDTIVVSPGTYSDNISITGKYITIESTNGPTQTIIKPAIPGPILVWQNTPFTGGIQARFSGFTVSGGSSNLSQSGRAGGLTLASNADVQVSNDDIIDNSSVNPGAGLIIDNSSPVISGVTVQNNSSTSLGGGALIVNLSRPTFYNSVFSSNSAGAGGGVWIDSNSSPVLVNNQFNANLANGPGGTAGGGEGGAIGVRGGSSPVIANNSFSGNTAWYGGGIDLETQGGVVQIQNNTFNSNSAKESPWDSGSGFGGALSAYGGSVGQASNNWFQGNTAAQGGGAIVIAENSNLSLNQNTMYSNTASGNGGGAVYSANASVQLSQNCILDNVAQNGAGIAALGGSSVTMNHNSIIQNIETRTDVNWIPGGLYVNLGITSLTSSGDLIAENNGPQVYDEGPNGFYTSDLFYPSSNNADLFAYGTTSLQIAQTLSALTNSPVQTTTLSDFLPSFTNIGAGQCYTDPTTASSSFGIPQPNPSNLVAVYRFFGTQNQTHFFTDSTTERNAVLAIQPVSWYHYEGIAFYAYSSQITGTIPVYRFYQLSSTGSHFYTASQAEATYLETNEANQWQYEGVAFYAFPASTTGMSNVFRFVNVVNGSHFYTASQAEANYVQQTLSSEWQYEGSAFSVPPAQ